MALGLRLAGLSAALAVGSGAAGAIATAQESEIVVEAAAPRAEIERILVADNLDTANLGAEEIVAVMAAIPQGNAPQDFWRSYQRHLRAWQTLAEGNRPGRSEQEQLALRNAVNSTFDEVERIAQRYGARLPKPRADQ